MRAISLVTYSYVTLTVLVITVSGQAALAVRSALNERDHLREIYEERILPTRTLRDIQDLIKDIPYRMAEFLGGQLPADQAKSKLLENLRQLRASWETFRSYPVSSGQEQREELINAVESGLGGSKVFFDRLLDAYGGNDRKAVTELMTRSWPDLQIGIQVPVRSLLDLHTAQVLKIYEKSKAQALNSIVISALFLIGCLGVFVLVGLYCARLGLRVSKVVRSIQEGTNKVSSVSTQIIGKSMLLSSNADDHSNAVKEANSSIEEIMNLAEQTVDTASKAIGSLRASASSASDGKRIANDLQGAINEITFSNLNLETIGLVIDQIGERTKAVNNIVFKTQILAFNASIEAAKAGYAGRSFSVVADEIGKLAESSGRVAREIQELIEQSRKRVREIILSTTITVAKGQETSGRCEKALQTMYQCVHELNELFESISDTGSKQEEGVRHADRVMNEMDTTNRKNLEAAYATDTLAKELRSQFDQLAGGLSDLQGIFMGSQGPKPERRSLQASLHELRPPGSP